MIIYFLNILFLVSLSLWIGSIFFFSFLTAPTVFRELPREVAGEFISKLFPPYYILGYITLFIASISLTFRGILEKPFPWFRLSLLILMMGCTFYAGIKIHPKAHLVKTVIRTMEEGKEKDTQQAAFNRLHKLSVLLNSATFLAAVLVLIITATKLRF